MKLWFNSLTLTVFLVFLGTSPIWLLLGSLIWVSFIQPLWFVWLGVIVYYLAKKANATIG